MHFVAYYVIHEYHRSIIYWLCYSWVL